MTAALVLLLVMMVIFLRFEPGADTTGSAIQSVYSGINIGLVSMSHYFSCVGLDISVQEDFGFCGNSFCKITSKWRLGGASSSFEDGIKSGRAEVRGRGRRGRQGGSKGETVGRPPPYEFDPLLVNKSGK